MASKFPNGFKHGISIRGVPLVQTHPGKVFWVSNSTVMLSGQKGGSNGNDGSFDAPFSTLLYAISKTTASRGDVIFIKPGHAESVSAAAGIILSKAGVAIVGLGAGSLRPTFTWDTADTATITVTASNVTLYNLLFIGGYLNVATAFSVANAQVARDFTIDSCEFRDSSTILNFVKCVNIGTTANISSGLTFTNNKVFGLASSPGTGTTAIVTASAATRWNISGNVIIHDVKLEDTPALIESGALDLTGLLVDGNIVFRANTTCSGTGHLIGTSATACTGMVSNNYVKTLDVAAMLLIPTGTDLGFTNNLVSGTADVSGILIPAADSDGS